VVAAAAVEAAVSAGGLRGDEGALFARHNEALRRAVARRVRAPEAVIEDACAFAWLQLLRCQPRRDTALAWLRAVAVHEAWRLARQQRTEAAIDTTADPARERDTSRELAVATLVELGATLEQRLDAREALRALAALPDRQRRALQRKVAGLSYQEIAAEQDSSTTAVNRHLTRARRRLRDTRPDR
jgi:RNA polymerase sigma factor (sigma-70 family)